jgi:hypothetical protein
MLGYLRIPIHNPKEIASRTARVTTDAGGACHRNRIVRRHVMQAYARKGKAAAAMERASMLAYVFPS